MEVRNRRIVECDVAILPESHERQINWKFQKQVRIAPNLRVQISGIAV